jgi:hypothetical protein
VCIRYLNRVIFATFLRKRAGNLVLSVLLAFPSLGGATDILVPSDTFGGQEMYRTTFLHLCGRRC